MSCGRMMRRAGSRSGNPNAINQRVLTGTVTFLYTFLLTANKLIYIPCGYWGGLYLTYLSLTHTNAKEAERELLKGMINSSAKAKLLEQGI